MLLLDVVENMFPSLSATTSAMVSVPGSHPGSSAAEGAGEEAFPVPAGGRAPVSCFQGSPEGISMAARAMSMSRRRSPAYAFDTSPFTGTLTLYGSA